MAGRLGDGATARAWLAGAVPALEAARERIDAVNVFPVPDGDTGTNVLLTTRGAAEALAAADPGADDAEVWAALSRGALLAARGNSGVILSRYVGGLAEAVGRPAVEALRHAATAAREAVHQPEDGTVLTVAAVVARAAYDADARGLDDAGVLAAAAQEARRDLAAISAGHPVLRSARVVDAGACALIVLLDALAAALAGEDGAVDVGWLDAFAAPPGSTDAPAPTAEVAPDEQTAPSGEDGSTGAAERDAGPEPIAPAPAVVVPDGPASDDGDVSAAVAPVPEGRAGDVLDAEPGAPSAPGPQVDAPAPDTSRSTPPSPGPRVPATHDVRAPADPAPHPGATDDAHPTHPDRYEVVAALRPHAAATPTADLSAALAALGSSVAVAEAGDVRTVHVHVADPAAALAALVGAGSGVATVRTVVGAGRSLVACTASPALARPLALAGTVVLVALGDVPAADLRAALDRAVADAATPQGPVTVLPGTWLVPLLDADEALAADRVLVPDAADDLRVLAAATAGRGDLGGLRSAVADDPVEALAAVEQLVDQVGGPGRVASATVLLGAASDAADGLLLAARLAVRHPDLPVVVAGSVPCSPAVRVAVLPRAALRDPLLVVDALEVPA
ncbi:DAK2 domain-containing protein [Cellulomonas triticagri]|uniref:DAK2 domain-containing protein n=1 Tax=Cellulomonas triticagri TaxID=2483352 RepID=UPI0013157E91|nr:DAK2 domain-containing protein [Cellulomonas triticagri]